MMEHLNIQSMDKVAANVAKIMELFPNCVTERINAEGKSEHTIDFDMLKQELSDYVVDGLQERYQFTWPDKRKAILAANAPINKTLRPAEKRAWTLTIRKTFILKATIWKCSSCCRKHT